MFVPKFEKNENIKERRRKEIFSIIFIQKSEKITIFFEIRKFLKKNLIFSEDLSEIFSCRLKIIPLL